MTITAVRLQQVNKQKNFGMRTYVSATSRTKYSSGTDVNPSPFRVLKDMNEIPELLQFPQFEILEFDDLDHLREFIQDEMEGRARMGLPAVRAAVLTGEGKGRVLDDTPKPRRAVADRLPAAAKGPASDPRKTNTGRQPVAQETSEAAAPAAEPKAEKKAPAKAIPKAKKAPAKRKPSKKKTPKPARKPRSTRPASDDE